MGKRRALGRIDPRGWRETPAVDGPSKSYGAHPMIRRFYADNFRCLTNFELELDETNIVLGPNGSGKTSFFDALRGIRDLTVRGVRIEEAFPQRDLSCLRNGGGVQRFELELRIDQDIYGYTLSVAHDPDRNKICIRQEVLEHDKKPLFVYEKGIVQLYRDDYRKGLHYPFYGSRSAIGFLNLVPDNKKLVRFKTELANSIIASPCPPLFRSESSTETGAEGAFLDPLMENFVEWYWSIAQENMGAAFRLFKELHDVLPGFDSLSMVKSGENARALKAEFHSRSNDKRPNRYGFGQLSDGQRALTALYSLLHLVEDRQLAEGHRRSLFIDEPDNYLSLREVQPWLAQVVDACGETLEQAVIISHHPITIDYLAGSKARWFSRDGEGPVRVGNESKFSADGLSISEAIAKGWEEE